MASESVVNLAFPKPEGLLERDRYSPSKLKAYHFCEQRAHYHYMHDLRVEGADTAALLRGKITHDYLEQWHRDGITPTKLFASMMAKYDSYMGQTLVPWCNTLMVRYIGKYGKTDPKRYIFHTVEQEYYVTSVTPKGREIVLTGRIDTIVEDTQEKLLGPWDHKTSAYNLWSPKAVMFDAQLNQYAVMCMLMGYPVNAITINQLYTGFTSVEGCANAPLEKLFRRSTVEVSPRRLERWQNNIGARIDKIIDMQEAVAAGTAEFEMNQGSHCPQCPFEGACALTLDNQDPTFYIEKILTPLVKNNNPAEIDMSALEGFDFDEK